MKKSDEEITPEKQKNQMEENHEVKEKTMQSLLEKMNRLEQKIQMMDNMTDEEKNIRKATSIEKGQESNAKGEQESKIAEAHQFFDAFFRDEDENNPYVKNLFLEVLSILYEKGEKDLDYASILKMARKKFKEEIKDVLNKWTPDELVDTLGEGKLSEINEFVIDKKKFSSTSPISLDPKKTTKGQTGGRSELLLQ